MKRLILGLIFVLGIVSYAYSGIFIYFMYDIDQTEFLKGAYFSNNKFVDICQDGTKVTYSEKIYGSGWDIFTSHMKGENRNHITKNWKSDDPEPILSKNCNKIAFSSNKTGEYDIWISSFDGKHKRNISGTKSYPYGCTNCGADVSPAFSLDAKKVFFVRCDIVDTRYLETSHRACWATPMVADLETNEISPILNNYKKDIKELVTAYQNEFIIMTVFEGGYKRLYKMNYDGSGMKLLSGHINYSIEHPKISFDDQYVAFNIKDQYKGGTDWYRALVMNIETGDFREVREGDLFQRPYPIWFPANGRYVIGLLDTLIAY